MLGRTGLSVSRVGFGGYRIDLRDPEHRAALELALQMGCNLIDTSTNYTDGESEKLIGEVISKFKREEIVVVTKAGYIQGTNLKNAMARDYAEVVHFSKNCWHCISPDFLQDQISESLDRLQIKQIDVLLLHNPEYFLKAGGEHPEYYHRIEKAFRHLENEVRAGRIRHYGVSSNTLPDPKESPEATSLEVLHDLAEKIAEENSEPSHFSVVQFPFNLYEVDAAFEGNNSGKTVLEFAREKNLGTLINRPLNAFSRDKLIRLADFNPHPDVPLLQNLKDALQTALAFETEMTPKGKPIVRGLNWAHVIKQNFERLSVLTEWKPALKYQIKPELDEALAGNPLEAKYRELYTKLFSTFTALLEAEASIGTLQRAKVLDEYLPELASTPSFSQKCLRIYQSMPGLTSVLVGMRTPDYVKNACVDLEPLEYGEKTERALQALQSLWGESNG
jgi:aryl-alcohol dehydrogenase-like predicted oxidoreductase